MKSKWVAVAAVGVVLSACGPSEPPTPCSEEITSEVTPTQATINPGETLQASYRVFTCGGDMQIEVTSVWESADEAIATVSSTGLISAGLQGGNTTITVSAQNLDVSKTIAVSVPVVDPIP